MDKEVFPRQDVAAALEGLFVAVKIETESNPQVVQNLGITAVPTDMVVTPQGEIVYRRAGGATAKQYVEELRAVGLPWREQQFRIREAQQLALRAQQPAQNNPLPGGIAPPTAIPMQGERDLAPPVLQPQAQQPFTQVSQQHSISQHNAIGSAQGGGLTEMPPTETAPHTEEVIGETAATANVDPLGMLDPYTNVGQPGVSEPVAESTGNFEAVSPRLLEEEANFDFPPLTLDSETQGVAQTSAQPEFSSEIYDEFSVPSAERIQPSVENIQLPTDPIQQSDGTIQPQAEGMKTPSLAASSSAVASPGPPSLLAEPNLGMVAASPSEQPPQVSAFSEMPLIFDGYCPVELQDRERWTPGNEKWSLHYAGRIFVFSSQEAMQTFAKHPGRYTPVAMGNDILLMIKEKKQIPGQRHFGAWYQGKIYLFATQENYEAFEKNPGYFADLLQKLEISLNVQP